MTQSKPIQKIVIPSAKSSDKDDSFRLFKFLFDKSKEGRKSNCPLRGSLGYLIDKPVASIFFMASLILFVLILSPIHLFKM